MPQPRSWHASCNYPPVHPSRQASGDADWNWNRGQSCARWGSRGPAVGGPPALFFFFTQPRDAGSAQLEKRWSPLASGGAAVVRGSGASPGSAVLGSNRRTQAIHGLLAPDPRTTASFAPLRPEASSSRGTCAVRSFCCCCGPTKPGHPSRRRTSMQGVRVRAVHGCTAPACWSRTRNHAADANPLQRRPPPEAKLLPLSLRPPPEASAVALVVAAPPEADKCRRFSAGPDPVALKLNFLPQLRATGSSREEIKRNSPAEAGLF